MGDPRAIASELGEEMTHRMNRHLNNHLEQEQRGIKQRVRPMLGFKRFTSVARFRLAHDELRRFLRLTTALDQSVSLTRRRVVHTRRLCVLTKLLKAT